MPPFVSRVRAIPVHGRFRDIRIRGIKHRNAPSAAVRSGAAYPELRASIRRLYGEKRAAESSCTGELADIGLDITRVISR